MEAVIVVLLVALLAVAAAAVLMLLAQRRPAHEETDAQRLEQQTQRLELQLASVKTDLAQALTTSQQTVLSQVSAVDGKLNQRLDAVQSAVGQRLDAVDNRIGQSLTSTQTTIKDVNERLGQLSQSTKQMLEIGKDISDLQTIMRPPKLRGGFGEMLLERLLADMLPAKNYSTQFAFRNGLRVDAVIRIGDGMVPVDSKFPLDAFNRMTKAESDEERAALRKDFVRAVRGHIDAVAKYILPDERCFPFALMYIPAENVYYEVIVKDEYSEGQADLSGYAMERRVVPVSPNSFHAYLQAILIGLKGMQVEEHAQDIMRNVERLSGEFVRIKKDFGTLGAHIKNASDRYGDVDRAFTKFGDRLSQAINEPIQAPLPDPQLAPAPRSEPALTNGHDEP